MSALIPLQLLLPVRVVVDRIEPPMAVVEWPSGELTDVPLLFLPADLREGAVLLLQPGPASCPEPVQVRR